MGRDSSHQSQPNCKFGRLDTLAKGFILEIIPGIIGVVGLEDRIQYSGDDFVEIVTGNCPILEDGKQ